MNFKAAGCFILAISLLAGCNSNGPEADVESEIRNAMSTQQDAWNSGDIKGFMAAYAESPDLTFTTSEGITKGFTTVLDRYTNAYPTKEEMGTLQFELKEFDKLGEKSALVIGTWELSREPDNPKGYFSLIWKHTPEGWKIIHDHTS